MPNHVVILFLVEWKGLPPPPWEGLYFTDLSLLDSVIALYLETNTKHMYFLLQIF